MKLASRQILQPVEIAGQYINGYHCIAVGANCLGDNQDALYLATDMKSFNNTLNSTMLHVIVGLNHNSTGKSVYSNIALYVEGALGPDGLASVNNFAYQNSAMQWSPAVENANLAFVVTVSFDCSGDPTCINAAKAGVKNGQAVGYAERAYLETATKTGPSIAEIVPATLLVFVSEN